MKSFKNTCLILVLVIIQVYLVKAQDAPQYKYIISSESKLWFEGTSTLHGYKCVAKEITGSFIMKEMISDSTTIRFSNAAIAGILQIPVLSIDSGKGKMDKKMRKLLKADDHPEIIFELTSLELTASGKDQVQLKTMGNVKVAGVEKTIALEVIGNLEPNGTIRFSGSKKLLMTDFNIKPPTMFFGRLKTGNEITVYFEIALIPSIQISLN